MAVFKDVDEARSFFCGDRFAMENGIILEKIGEGFSICSLELSDHNRNANGAVMGGAVFTLADFAFAVAANNLHRPTVTEQVSIYYLNAPKGTKLIARAECRKNGRTSCACDVTVTDDLGCEVALFIGIGHKILKPESKSQKG